MLHCATSTFEERTPENALSSPQMARIRPRSSSETSVGYPPMRRSENICLIFHVHVSHASIEALIPRRVHSRRIYFSLEDLLLENRSPRRLSVHFVFPLGELVEFDLNFEATSGGAGGANR